MKHASVFMKGMIIGIANIIPGVSGGTLALILGLYERLIRGIHSVSIKTFISFLRLFTFRKKDFDAFKNEMTRIDIIFIATLFSGAVAAIFLLASFMSFILNAHHDPTYGFFFGLIIASVTVPYRLIKRKTALVFIAMAIAALCVASTSLFLSNDKVIAKEQAKYELKLSEKDSITTTEVEHSLIQAFILFIAGAVSVSAMILPGISGSFILLLMGQYFIILKAVSDFNLFYISATALGMIIGLLVFTKFLNYLLQNFYDITMGFLTGLVAGSLYVIWPFRASVEIGTSAVKGYPETVYLNNILPHKINDSLIMTVICMLAGILIVSIMVRMEKKHGKE